MRKKRQTALAKHLAKRPSAKSPKVADASPSVDTSQTQEAVKGVAGVRLGISGLRKDMEEGGLGTLDFSGLLTGGGLVASLLQTITAAMGGTSEVALATKASFDNFKTSVGALSLGVEGALLPALGDVFEAVKPFVDSLADFTKANPGLVKGLAVTALAFTVLTIAAMGAVTAFGVLMSPIGLVAAAIAIAAGLIVANWGAISQFFEDVWSFMKTCVEKISAVIMAVLAWSPMAALASVWGGITGYFQELWDGITSKLQQAWNSISEFFSQVWNRISEYFVQAWSYIKSLFDWSPRAVIESAWNSVSEFFSQQWSNISANLGMAWDLIKSYFNWSPMEMIRGLWDPMSGYFSELWDGLLELAQPVIDVLKTLFDWTPLGLIIAHWEPITEWFSKWWDKLQGIIAPFKELIGGKIGGLIEMVAGGADEGESDGDDPSSARRKAGLLKGESPISAAQASSSLGQNSSALLQQSALNNRSQLEGGLTVRFENAPPGMRADAPHSNQPNLQMASLIGYRTLSLGGSHGGQLA